MITLYCLTLISIMMISMFMTTINPVKMMSILLITSGVSILMMKKLLGSSWFPMIIYLLFTGGILIVFMIMASLLPNEKFLKMNKSKMMILCLSSLSILLSQSNMMSPTSLSKTKWFSESSTSMMLIMYIVMLYFFSFLKLIQSSKNPLRSSFCS